MNVQIIDKKKQPDTTFENLKVSELFSFRGEKLLKMVVRHYSGHFVYPYGRHNAYIYLERDASKGIAAGRIAQCSNPAMRVVRVNQMHPIVVEYED